MNKVLAQKKVIGLVFLALLASSVWLTVAIFNKKFTEYDEVAMESSSVGLQLPARADVKIRGVLVGEVLTTRADTGGAVLTLGLYPDQIDTIPENVTARIEPKTLFGEKYVALQVPEAPSSQTIAAGDTIERTVVGTEVEEAINDLYPLLRTVQPADLNRTLTALATALEGRGELIGKNLETLDSYLKRINPQLPKLVEDIKLTGRVAGVYNEVFPEIAKTLRNAVTTGNTLKSHEKKLNQLFTDVSRFSEVTGTFLDKNEENLIRVGELGAQQFRVLAKYAPEFPCLLGGIVKSGDHLAEAFRGFTLHINLELLPHQPRSYDAKDAPRFGAKNGPYCGTLPDSPYNQENKVTSQPNFDDGIDEPTGKGTMRTAPSYAEVSAAAGSPAESEMVRGVLAAQQGVPADEVSDLSVMLLAPMMRGTEVSLR
ncbi:MAG: MCE family protein [Nocardioides sp.]|nr:MCE family protein [Nocardioides sp.]